MRPIRQSRGATEAEVGENVICYCYNKVYILKSFLELLSLFSVLTFPNDACTSASDTTMQGTCLTATECSNQGGTKDGNCAAGDNTIL